MQGEIPESERREPIEHAEEIVPDGYRITNPETRADLPASWAFFDGEGLLVIDPGGELPIETAEDQDRLKSVAALVTGIDQTPKLHAIRELERRYNVPVKAILLTHGDVDHTNNIEDVAPTDTPIFVGQKGYWSTLSPEKQFSATVVNRKRSKLTGHNPGSTYWRDLSMKVISYVVDNRRGGPDRVERKRALAARLHHYEFPATFPVTDDQLHVVQMPGHAPEEVGFYLPEHKIMIGGDLISTNKPDQANRLDLFLSQANVYDALETLDRLQSMDIEQYYPSHGQPILGRENIQAHIQVLKDDANEIINRTKDLHKEHPDLTDSQLARLVFSGRWDRKGMVMTSKESWVFSILRDRPREQTKE